MIRREIGGLEFARPALAARDIRQNTWVAGLLAMCTELGLAQRARALLHRSVDQDLPGLRDSSTWPAALSFLADATITLDDRRYGDVLLPRGGALRRSGPDAVGFPRGLRQCSPALASLPLSWAGRRRGPLCGCLGNRHPHGLDPARRDHARGVGGMAASIRASSARVDEQAGAPGTSPRGTGWCAYAVSWVRTERRARARPGPWTD